VSQKVAEQVGPILVTMERPGYRRQVRSVWARRIWKSIPDEVFKLEPVAQESGGVKIQFLPIGFELETKVSIRLNGTMNQPPMYLTLPNISAAPCVISGIPCDDFICEVRICDGLLKLSKSPEGNPLRLRILPDLEAALSINLQDQAILELCFRDELGLSYLGPMTVRIIGIPSDVVRHISYSGPPYFVLGLPGGEYSVAGIRGYSAATWIGDEEYRMQLSIHGTPLQSAVVDSRYQQRMQIR
jgi:hypothetical protein